jgi:hypothetical protein
MLTVVDEFTRECHLIHVDRRIRSGDVRRQAQGAGNQDSLHRTGKPLAEWVHRELQRPPTSRMPGARATLDALGGSSRHRGLASAIQSDPPAPEPGIRNTEGLRLPCRSSCGLRSGYALPASTA